MRFLLPFIFYLFIFYFYFFLPELAILGETCGDSSEKFLVPRCHDGLLTHGSPPSQGKDDVLIGHAMEWKLGDLWILSLEATGFPLARIIRSGNSASAAKMKKFGSEISDVFACLIQSKSKIIDLHKSCLFPFSSLR